MKCLRLAKHWAWPITRTMAPQAEHFYWNLGMKKWAQRGGGTAPAGRREAGTQKPLTQDPQELSSLPASKRGTGLHPHPTESHRDRGQARPCALSSGSERWLGHQLFLTWFQALSPPQPLAKGLLLSNWTRPLCSHQKPRQGSPSTAFSSGLR